MKTIQKTEAQQQETGIALVRMSVRRVEAEQVVREGTTGRVVASVPRPAEVPIPVERPKIMLLPRVWAVAETIEVEPEAMPFVAVEDVEAEPEVETEQRVGLAFYRKYTEGMLRRYVRMSMACGRVPSLLGRELFQGKVTSYRVTNFEDAVIFCFDMEKLLDRLRPMDQRLIKRIGMQEYTQAETASLFRMSVRTVLRTYGEAVDRLTEMLLEAGMLEPLKSCQ